MRFRVKYPDGSEHTWTLEQTEADLRKQTQDSGASVKLFGSTWTVTENGRTYTSLVDPAHAINAAIEAYRMRNGLGP